MCSQDEFDELGALAVDSWIHATIAFTNGQIDYVNRLLIEKFDEQNVTSAEWGRLSRERARLVTRRFAEIDARIEALEDRSAKSARSRLEHERELATLRVFRESAAQTDPDLDPRRAA